MPTVIVTGSTGLVGSALVAHLARQGFQVRAFQRSKPARTISNVTYYPFDLNNVQDTGYEGADYLVHCAYRPFTSRAERESGVNIDIEGTKKILSFSRLHGVKVIFLSTFSAHPKAQSYYARHKLIAERLFDVRQDLILKLGLVLGSGGGLFGRILRSLRRYWVVPLIGGGQQKVQTIASDDVCEVIESGIRNEVTGTYLIAHPASITLKELYYGMVKSIDVHRIFIPIPWIIAYTFTRLLERIGFTLPFSAENILGLQDLRVYDTVPSLKAFGVTTKDYRATLRQVGIANNVGISENNEHNK